MYIYIMQYLSQQLDGYIIFIIYIILCTNIFAFYMYSLKSVLNTHTNYNTFNCHLPNCRKYKNAMYDNITVYKQIKQILKINRKKL